MKWKPSLSWYMILVLAVFDEGPLDLLGGLKAQRDLDPVGDPPHVHLGDGGALAGVDILGRDDHAELAVNLDDIAFSQRAGDDFHGFLDELALSRGAT